MVSRENRERVTALRLSRATDHRRNRRGDRCRLGIHQRALSGHSIGSSLNLGFRGTGSRERVDVRDRGGDHCGQLGDGRGEIGDVRVEGVDGSHNFMKLMFVEFENNGFCLHLKAEQAYHTAMAVATGVF